MPVVVEVDGKEQVFEAGCKEELRLFSIELGQLFCEQEDKHFNSKLFKIKKASG